MALLLPEGPEHPQRDRADLKGFRPTLQLAQALLRSSLASFRFDWPDSIGADQAIIAAARHGLGHRLASRTRIGIVASGASAGALTGLSSKLFNAHPPQAIVLVAPRGPVPKTPWPGPTTVIADLETPTPWREFADCSPLDEMGAGGEFRRGDGSRLPTLHPGLIDRVRTHLGMHLRPPWESGAARAPGIAIGS